MTITNLDIYRSASVLISRYGAAASLHAANRADEMLAEGDLDGRAVWGRIHEAVLELGRVAPGEGERCPDDVIAQAMRRARSHASALSLSAGVFHQTSTMSITGYLPAGHAAAMSMVLILKGSQATAGATLRSASQT